MKTGWINSPRRYGWNYDGSASRGSGGESAPTAPSNAATTQTALRTLTTTWTDNSSTEDGFSIERKTTGSYAVIGTVGAGVTTYADTTVAIGTEYTYRVNAYKGALYSTYSTATAITPSYQYGYPTFGASEPNVKAQWTFEEGFYNFTGITSEDGTEEFSNTSAQSALDTGTSDFTIYALVKFTNLANGYRTIFSTQQGNYHGVSLQLEYHSVTHPNGQIVAYWESSDGTVVLSKTWSALSVTLFDGLIHSIRIKCDRDGNAEAFVDNVTQGTAAMSNPTKTVTAGGTWIMGDSIPYDNGAYDVTVYEVAFGTGLTLGATSGPGNVGPWDYISDSTSGLKCHFKMQEASGDLVDTINGITLADAGTPVYSVAGAGNATLVDAVSGIKLAASGTSTYGVAATGAFAGLSPGITRTADSVFAKTTATSAFNVGTTDHVIFEDWFSTTDDIGEQQNLFTLCRSDDTNIQSFIVGFASPTALNIDFYDDSNGSTSATFTVAAVNDGTLRKLRAVLNRTTNYVTMFLDGVIIGTVSAADHINHTFTNGAIRVGTNAAGNASKWLGTTYELRISIGTDVLTNDSGGPPATSYVATNSDPNVKALWYFDETGGTNPQTIVDEISGITLVKGVDGTFTGSQTAAAPFDVISPGILLSPGGGSSAWWVKSTATASLDVGASDHIVVECYLSSTNNKKQGPFALFGTYTTASNHMRFGIDTAATNTWYWELVTSDGSTITKSWNAAYPFVSDNIMKIRIAVDRAGNAEFFFNGVSQGTVSTAGISGDTIGCDTLCIGALGNNGTDPWGGSTSPNQSSRFYLMRISIGTDVLSNNLGGPNGG